MGQAEDTQKEGYVTAEADIGVTQLQAKHGHHQRLGEGRTPPSLRGWAPRPRLAGLPASEPREKEGLSASGYGLALTRCAGQRSPRKNQTPRPLSAPCPHLPVFTSANFLRFQETSAPPHTP